MLREPPARAACSGEYGNALRHWSSFSYSDVGFAGHDQVTFLPRYTILLQLLCLPIPGNIQAPTTCFSLLGNTCSTSVIRIKHGDLVAAKCEYQRCKVYECNANYYKNNAADDGV